MIQRTSYDRPFPFLNCFAFCLAAFDVLYLLLVWTPLHDKNLNVDDYQLWALAQNEPGLLHMLGGVLTLLLPCAAPLLFGLLVATVLNWSEASVRLRLLRVLLVIVTLTVFSMNWSTWSQSLIYYL